jgi:hypothetical protein
VSNPSNPTTVVFTNAASAEQGALLLVTSGTVTANSVVFSLDGSSAGAFILLTGGGSVVMQEITVKVCSTLFLFLFLPFFFSSVWSVFESINAGVLFLRDCR